MAPSANHPLRFREYDKEAMLFDQSWAALLAAFVAARVVIMWCITPLWQRRRRCAE